MQYCFFNNLEATVHFLAKCLRYTIFIRSNAESTQYTLADSI